MSTKTRWLILATVLVAALASLILFDPSHLIPGFGRPGGVGPVSEERLLGFGTRGDPPGFQIATTLPHYRASIRRPATFRVPAFAETDSLMVTVETHGFFAHARFGLDVLLQVADGDFDSAFIRLCRALPADGQGVYLRFNPEMEVPSFNLPWQKYPSRYIPAYRRFARICQEYAPAAKLVWAPAGYPGCSEYFPGLDVVDAISITCRATSENKLTVYPKHSPAVDLYRRLHRMRHHPVPVMALTTGELPADMEGTADTVSRYLLRADRLTPRSGDADQRQVDHLLSDATSFEIGLYDPQGSLLDDDAVSVEHIFVDLGNIKSGKMERRFRDVVDRGHDLILTFEPFRPLEGSTDMDVLRSVTRGMLDDELRELYRVMASTDRRVYFRYAHEMEIPIDRYPWQSQDPLDYIESFRYVMTFDSLPTNVVRVWGPAGDRGSDEFYPGDDVVDVISIAIYGLPDKNITDPEKQETFKKIFQLKRGRMRFINKPMFITEFGVKGSEAFQDAWLGGAAQVLRNSENVIGVNYFNMHDVPGAWGEIKPPDWSISKASLRAFAAALNEPSPKD